jgi:hypothetical protein
MYLLQLVVNGDDAFGRELLDLIMTIVNAVDSWRPRCGGSQPATTSRCSQSFGLAQVGP